MSEGMLLMLHSPTPRVSAGGCLCRMLLMLHSSTPTTPQHAKQVFLATAWAQGAHSPAGLQGVNITFGVFSRLQNCLNTVLEFLALNYSHQDKGLKCEVIVR